MQMISPPKPKEELQSPPAQPPQSPQSDTQNPFRSDSADDNPFGDEEEDDDYVVREREKATYESVFQAQGPVDGKLNGSQVKSVLVETGVPTAVLRKIWNLSDIDLDGKLDLDEFAIAMRCVFRISWTGMGCMCVSVLTIRRHQWLGCASLPRSSPKTPFRLRCCLRRWCHLRKWASSPRMNNHLSHFYREKKK